MKKPKTNGLNIGSHIIFLHAGYKTDKESIFKNDFKVPGYELCYTAIKQNISTQEEFIKALKQYEYPDLPRTETQGKPDMTYVFAIPKKITESIRDDFPDFYFEKGEKYSKKKEEYLLEDNEESLKLKGQFDEYGLLPNKYLYGACDKGTDKLEVNPNFISNQPNAELIFQAETTKANTEVQRTITLSQQNREAAQ